jgi:hypothetical protein
MLSKSGPARRLAGGLTRRRGDAETRGKDITSLSRRERGWG